QFRPSAIFRRGFALPLAARREQGAVRKRFGPRCSRPRSRDFSPLRAYKCLNQRGGTMLRAFASSLLALAIGCPSLNPSNVMQSWVGHSVAELVGSWGPPQYVLDDPRYKGCKIFIYTAERQFVSPGTSQTYTSASITGWGNYAYLATTTTTYYAPPQV